MSQREGATEGPAVVASRRLLESMVYNVAEKLPVAITSGNMPRDLAERFVFALNSPKIHVLISEKASNRDAFVCICKKLFKVHMTIWSNLRLSNECEIDLNCSKGDLKIIVCSHDEFAVIQELVRGQRSEGSVKVTTGVQYFRDFYKEWIDSMLQ